MPATHTKNIKKAISELKIDQRNAVSRCSYLRRCRQETSSDHTDHVGGKEQKGEKEIHTFVTNMSVDAVCEYKCDYMTWAEAFVEQYRIRWPIETGYRCTEFMRLRTTSKDESVRVLLLLRPSFCLTRGYWYRTCYRETALTISRYS